MRLLVSNEYAISLSIPYQGDDFNRWSPHRACASVMPTAKSLNGIQPGISACFRTGGRPCSFRHPRWTSLANPGSCEICVSYFSFSTLTISGLNCLNSSALYEPSHGTGTAALLKSTYLIVGSLAPGASLCGRIESMLGSESLPASPAVKLFGLL